MIHSVVSIQARLSRWYIVLIGRDTKQNYALKCVDKPWFVVRKVKARSRRGCMQSKCHGDSKFRLIVYFNDAHQYISSYYIVHCLILFKYLFFIIYVVFCVCGILRKICWSEAIKSGEWRTLSQGTRSAVILLLWSIQCFHTWKKKAHLAKISPIREIIAHIKQFISDHYTPWHPKRHVYLLCFFAEAFLFFSTKARFLSKTIVECTAQKSVRHNNSRQAASNI